MKLACFVSDLSGLLIRDTCLSVAKIMLLFRSEVNWWPPICMQINCKKFNLQLYPVLYLLAVRHRKLVVDISYNAKLNKNYLSIPQIGDLFTPPGE